MAAPKLIRSTSTVAGLTLLSRILGFARDIILANIFGAGGIFDAFVVAFKLPNFLRRLFGEGAFSQAFVPVLAEYRAKHTPSETQLFVDHIAGTLSFVVLWVVILAEIAAPLLVMIFAPGFLNDPVRYHVCLHLLHILFPYLLLIVLTALMGAVLNTYGIFGPPALAPSLLNIALIGAALLWAPFAAVPIYALGFGVLIGGILQLIVQLPSIKRIHLFPRLKLGFQEEGVRRVIKRMVPALFGVSVAQIGLFIDNVFASFLQEGSISWLYYSDRLIYFPLGVIGVAIATVVMPSLSRNYASQDEVVFSTTLDWALRTVLLIGLPAATGLFVLSGPILATLIHYGKFNSNDVIMTSRSLKAFAIGLPAFMLIKILASAFYSRQNIQTPVKIAVVAVIANIILNFILIFPLKHAGLALATSLSSILNASLLWITLMKKNIFHPQKLWAQTSARLLVANVAMGLLIFYLAGSITPWLSWSIFLRLSHLIYIILSGITSYIVILWMMGIRLHDFKPTATS